jgi:hypothetical protein
VLRIGGASSRHGENHPHPVSAIAICVELFRLVHAPWLDAFRLTLAGALLLGRIFSAWDMLAYGVGIVLGMLLDRAGTCSVRDAPHSAS